jgi:hypothetical protein
LEYSTGVTKDALLWFKSYLMDKTQRVAIWSVQSDDIKLCFGVPQGSVLGPKLYCIFAKPVGEISYWWFYQSTFLDFSHKTHRLTQFHQISIGNRKNASLDV